MERAAGRRPPNLEEVSAASPVSRRRRNVIFIAVCLAMLMSSVDITVVATALTTFTRDLNTTINWSAWTISAYQLGAVTAGPIAGRLSDSLGRKRMMIALVLIFTLSSLCCGLSFNIFMLIGFRFIQALGGGGLMPSATGIIADQFGDDRERPIGLTTSIVPLGALIGPALGGLIVTYFSWRLIFFINLPLGILVLVLTWLLLPADAPGRRKRLQIDGLSPVIFVLMLASLMLGLNQLASRGFGSPIAWGLIAAFVVGAAVWMLRQQRVSNPLLPPALLTKRVFVIINTLNFVFGASAFGIFSLVPLYAQVRFGMSALAAGSMLTIRAIAMSTCSTITALFILRRYGYRSPMAVGFITVALGLAFIALTPVHLSAFTWLAIGAVITGAGIGIAAPPSNNAALQLMPDQIGAVSALRLVFRQTGGIVAISASAALIANSSSGARVLAGIFAAFAALSVLSLPLIRAVPEHPRAAPA